VRKDAQYAGGNLCCTTGFRRMYAMLITQWMRCPDSTATLRGNFAPSSLD